jgi:transposase
MRVEVLGGVERRRRWSRDDKMRIIEETLAPGAVVTEIARRHGISTSLVFTWRSRQNYHPVLPLLSSPSLILGYVFELSALRLALALPRGIEPLGFEPSCWYSCWHLV